MNKSTRTSETDFRVGIAKRLRWLPALIPVLIWMSLSGCKEVVVLSSDQTETFVKAKQVFEVPTDGVFMPAARYQRYRRAVADEIQRAEVK